MKIVIKTINKAINIKQIDERLTVELEGRKEMAQKTLLGITACAADATTAICGAVK